MSVDRQSIHGQWSSRFAFTLAATGSAVGLGNIWKFPYIAGENGGGAFVLVYLICILLIGIPVMMGEVLMGRRGRQSPFNSVIELCDEAGATRAWAGLGVIGVLAGTLMLSFYIVIAGWAFSYALAAGRNAFNGASAEEIGSLFKSLTDSPVRLTTWSTFVSVVTGVIVWRGVQAGLERTVRLLMPCLFALLLLLVGYAMSTDAFMQGISFLFKPDFNQLSANGALVALGHAFFTLSLASGVMMAYGSYLPKGVSIAKTCLVVAAADTIVALLAGIAIFPIVFSYGLEPNAGPELVFVTLPIAFGQMPFGWFFGTLFFVMLVFAAITSAISLLEPVVAWLIERMRMTRGQATAAASFAVWVVGLGTVFSFNIGSDVLIFSKDFFGAVDYLTANIMLPLCGLLIASFTAWIMKERATRDELDLGDSPAYEVWQFTMRYVAPAAIVVVFLKAIEVIRL